MKATGKSTKAYRLHLVVKLREEGHTQHQISDLTGLSQGRVSQILKLYHQKGASALVIHSPPGRPAGLTTDQLDELKIILTAEAKASSFATDGWTLSRISKVIEDKFGLSYSLEHIRRILKNIGFTRQRPKAKDYRQDQEAIDKWKSQTLPKLKKSND